MSRWHWVLIGCTTLVALAGCGGGSQSGSGNPPPGQVSIGPITGPDRLQIGVSSPATYLYSAKVTGSSDTSVDWSLDDDTVATIAGTGVATPSAAKTGIVTITAKAHADPTKTSTLQVKVVDWILADFYAHLIDAQSGASTALMPMSPYEECSLSWDSLQFICIDIGADPENAFYVFQTDGTQPGTHRVAKIDLSGISGLTWSTYPRFSPDGKKLVFLGSVMVGLNFYTGPVVMNADGSGTPALLASNPDLFDTTLSAPRFTPDGKQVMFAQSTGLWIVNADGKNLRKLAASPAIQGVFSRDMTALYYSANGCIYKANTDGTNPVCVYDGDVSALMDISPNGKLLLFAAPQAVSATGTIYTVDVDGTNLQSLEGWDWATW